MSDLPSEPPTKQFKIDCEKCVKRRSAISQLKGINSLFKEKVSESRQLGHAVKFKTVINNTLRTKMRTLAADNLKKGRHIQTLEKQNVHLQDNLDQKKGHPEEGLAIEKVELKTEMSTT